MITFASINSPILSLNNYVAASLDTQQRIPYTPHRTTPKTKNPKLTVSPSPPTITTTNSPILSVSDLLNRPKQMGNQGFFHSDI